MKQGETMNQEVCIKCGDPRVYFNEVMGECVRYMTTAARHCGCKCVFKNQGDKTQSQPEGEQILDAETDAAFDDFLRTDPEVQAVLSEVGKELSTQPAELESQPTWRSDKAREAIHEAADLIANYYCYEDDTFFPEVARLTTAISEVVDCANSHELAQVIADRDALKAVLESLANKGCQIIHSSYPKGTTCLNIQEFARVNRTPHRFAATYRTQILSGERRCDGCIARAVLESQDTNSPDEEIKK